MRAWRSCPLVLGIWLMARLGFAQHGLAALLVVCACTALVLAPWVVRNHVLGGLLRGDDRLARALEGEQPEHVRRPGTTEAGSTMSRRCPAHRPVRRTRGQIYRETGRIVEVDECAQMRLYREEVVEFWREHPGEKARLAGQAARLLWQPNVLETEGRPGAGTWRDTARSVVEPAFMIALYVLAVARPVRPAPELRRADASSSSAIRRSSRCCSPARRGIACRGTSSSRSSPPLGIGAIASRWPRRRAATPARARARRAPRRARRSARA